METHTPECACWSCIATRAGRERDTEIERLRAENEQLTRGLSLYEREIEMLRAENEQLRAKLVERDQALTNWYQAATKRAIEIEKLETENERLRADLDAFKKAAHAEVAERERLKTELQVTEELLDKANDNCELSDRENKRLTESANALYDTVMQLRAEIEQLRKERDGWEAARGLELERANGLQAEVERLQGQLLNREASGEWLMAENERLQERLRLVAEGRN